MPSRRYWLSVWTSAAHDRLSVSSAMIAANNSMRLLVVCGSPPLSSRVWPFHCKIAPQPPGPGLPEQAPSVWMITRAPLTSSALDSIVARALDRLVEPQLAPVLERVLGPYHRARRDVEPIDQARQQEPQGSPAREPRKRGTFCFVQWPQFAVGLQQCTPLRYVERMVGLEAPRIETNREVVGERVGAGEIEVDQAGQSVAEKEDVIGEEVGMDHPLRKIAGPMQFQIAEFGHNSLPEIPLDAVSQFTGRLGKVSPAIYRERILAGHLEVGAGKMQSRERLAHRGTVGSARPPNPHTLQKR